MDFAENGLKTCEMHRLANERKQRAIRAKHRVRESGKLFCPSCYIAGASREALRAHIRKFHRDNERLLQWARQRNLAIPYCFYQDLEEEL